MMRRPISVAPCAGPGRPTPRGPRDPRAREALLVDGSHCPLLACPGCAQRFLSVLIETIDWADGEGPQTWSLQPVSAAEAARLTERESTETDLAALAPKRRRLRRDFPKGADPRAFWATGVAVAPHD